MLQHSLNNSLVTIKQNALYQPAGSFGVCDIWYDASSTNMSDVANGVGVDNWRNIGVQSNKDALQTTSANEPTMTAGSTVTNELKLRHIVFDGTNDSLDLDNAYVTNQAFTMAMVFDIDALNGDAIIAGETAGNNRFQVFQNAIQVRFNGTQTGNAGVLFNHNNTDNGSVSYQIFSGVEVIVMRKDSSDNLHLYNKNGDLMSHLPASTNTDDSMKIDRIGVIPTTPESKHIGGGIGELAVFTTDIGETSAKNLAKSLYTKWKK